MLNLKSDNITWEGRTWLKMHGSLRALLNWDRRSWKSLVSSLKWQAWWQYRGNIQVGWDLTWSNLLVKGGHRSGHSGLCQVESWIFPVRETPLLSGQPVFSVSLLCLWAQLPPQSCMLFSRTCLLSTKDTVSTPCSSWQFPVSNLELRCPSSLLWSPTFGWPHLPIETRSTWS